MATSFFGGAFFGGEFFSTPTGVEEAVKTGTGGIDPPRAYKPTGLAPRKKLSLRTTVDDRVSETQEIHREVVAEREAVAREAAMHAEIRVLLQKKLLDEEDDMLFLLLISAAD